MGQLWQPVEGRFKDYIRHPKSNGYQSLHATVHVHTVMVDLAPSPAGTADAPDRGVDAGVSSTEGLVSMEVQIRTAAMHAAAESGEAAHAAYKGGLDVRQARQLRDWTRSIQRSLLPSLGGQPAGPALPRASASWGGSEAAAEELFRCGRPPRLPRS